MITNVETIDPTRLRHLRWLVSKAIPTLQWRHSGLGVLQAYVRESGDEGEPELRVHVWDVNLRRAGIERSGLLHDHRFDLQSDVLLGGIGQVEYELTPADEGPWVLHEVLHARAAVAVGGNFDGAVNMLDGRYDAKIDQLAITEGQSYTFPKRRFHATHLLAPLVVTLVTKTNQESEPARILAPHGEPVVHAFADPLPRAAWQPTLDKAARLLLAAV